MPNGFYKGGVGDWQLAGLTLTESLYPANLKMPMHVHEPVYFGIVLNGRYTETLARRTRECKPLTTVFHPSGERHAVAFHSRASRIFRIELSAAWRARLSSYTKFPDQSAEATGGLLASLALRLYNEYRHRDGWSPMAIEGLALEIFAELSRATTKAANDSAPRWLEQAKEILAAQLTDTPTLAALAARVGVHPVHLAREFRKRFNCTVGDFIRRLRIESACGEIAQSDAPLCEVALRAGFYDQSHFSNTFKRFTGMTPAAYRTVCRAR